MLKNKNFLSVDDLTDQDIFYLINQAEKIQEKPEKFSEAAKGKILALLFFEPSTRTYFSFASAIQRLGGNYLGFSDTASTSMTKGESLEDTVRMMSAYADMLVVRHKEIGSLKRIADVVNIPVINAGEGIVEHPTQALTDLYTIYKHFRRFDITIALYGDLKFGRTNHSLLLAGARMGANFICIAPDELQMPKDYVQQAEQFGIKIILADNAEPYFEQMDVLYVSRLQKERLSSQLDYEKLKQQFLINQDNISFLKKNALIMHPLPRVGEIDPAIDTDPRAKYFEQVTNAVFMRMAIILAILDQKGR